MAKGGGMRGQIVIARTRDLIQTIWAAQGNVAFAGRGAVPARAVAATRA